MKFKVENNELNFYKKDKLVESYPFPKKKSAQQAMLRNAENRINKYHITVRRTSRKEEDDRKLMQHLLAPLAFIRSQR